MTKVTFYQNSNKHCAGFTVSDHAGYDVEGSDIVCAAISALVINTINSIDAFCEDEFVAESDEENARITLKLKEEPSESCLLLLNSLILGLQGMEDGPYKEFIDIIFEEV